MRKIISIALIFLLLTELTGCEAIQRKFTRKKKREPLTPRFYEEGATSETRPHVELYIMHYTYWKTWSEDLAVKAGENSKRDVLACNEIVGNLMDMRKHLIEDKAEELDVYIGQTREITDEIKKGRVNYIRLGLLKRKFDNVRMRILKNFYYKKVRNYIKEEE